MADLRSFIEAEIKTAEQEIQNIDIEIRKKAGPLWAKKTALEQIVSSRKSILKDFDKANKPPKSPKG